MSQAFILGNPPSSSWQRPADWIPIDHTPPNSITYTCSDAGFGLVAFIVTTTAGQFQVDWGDGTVLLYNSGATAQHIWNRGTGKPCSRGYTSFKVVITPVSGNILTCKVAKSTPPSGGGNGILEANINVDTLTDCSSMFSELFDTSNSTMLENVIFAPNSLKSATNLGNMFAKCYSLASATVPDAPNVTSTGSMFNYCSSLKYATFSNLQSNTSINTMFNNCYALKTVSFPAMPSLTAATNVFGTLDKCMSSSLDFSASTALTVLTMSLVPNLRGVLVSPSAPFSGASPQIDVSYTGLTDVALNALFNSLPTVTGKTIKVIGAVGVATCDKTIATAKGWTVT